MTRYIKFRELKERGIVNNRVTLQRWIADFGFPAGVKLGPNTRAWTDDEIEAWLAERTRLSASAPEAA